MPRCCCVSWPHSSARAESGACQIAIGGKPPPTFGMHSPVGGGLPPMNPTRFYLKTSTLLFLRLQILGQPLEPDHQRRVALDLDRLVLNPRHERQLLVLRLHRGEAVRDVWMIGYTQITRYDRSDQRVFCRSAKHCRDVGLGRSPFDLPKLQQNGYYYHPGKTSGHHRQIDD